MTCFHYFILTVDLLGPVLTHLLFLSGEERDPIRRDILPAGDVRTPGFLRGAGSTWRPQPRRARPRLPRQRPAAAAESHRPAQGVYIVGLQPNF